MTISNYSISLNSVQVFFGFVESCGYVPHSVKYTAYLIAGELFKIAKLYSKFLSVWVNNNYSLMRCG